MSEACITDSGKSCASKSGALFLKNIALEVHLGVTSEERASVQQVTVDVEVVFPKLPDGCRTDELKGTINYALLVPDIVALCAGREFNLIEHLCYEIHMLVQKFARQEGGKVSTSVIKNPPLPHLGASCFVINDLCD